MVSHVFHFFRTPFIVLCRCMCQDDCSFCDLKVAPASCPPDLVWVPSRSLLTLSALCSRIPCELYLFAGA